jgi:serine/threonine protein kinase
MRSKHSAWRPLHECLPARWSTRNLPRAFGPYTLLHRLASGGMAELYLGLLRGNFGFEKLVVVKCVLPFYEEEPAFIALLLDEARLAATLSHPNIVQVFAAGEIDGTYYIAMEHVEGLDLRGLLRRMVALGEQRPPLEHALLLIRQLLAGLGYAHDKCDFQGQPLFIVHRDISPHNVLVTHAGDVKIADFGIAKSAAQLGERSKAGVLKGKAAYMSPEHANGQKVDQRSDLFAVGVLLFELSTGKRLFKADNEAETLRLVCYEEYPRPSDVRPDYPPGLERIVMRALARDPAARHQHAHQMLAELEAFAEGARLFCSRLAFARWAEPFFADARARDQGLLRAIGSLAGSETDVHAEEISGSPVAATPAPGSGTPSRSGMRRSFDAAALALLVRRRRWQALGGFAAVLALVVALLAAGRSPSGWLGQQLGVIPGARSAAGFLDQAQRSAARWLTARMASPSTAGSPAGPASSVPARLREE